MTRLYRVLRKGFGRNPFDGEGAYVYGGRWSSPRIRLSYASEHQSLAQLEYFIHLDKDDPPEDLVLAVAQVPPDTQSERIEIAKLPANWRDPVAPPRLASIGDDFAQRGRHCLLLVPSALAPEEYNCLINPAHSEFKKLVIEDVEPLSY